EELRQDHLVERVPDRLRRLARIPRLLRGDALAPAHGTLALGAREDVRLVGLARAARLVRPLQREPHHEELDPLQPHGSSFAGSGLAGSGGGPAIGWGTSRYAPRSFVPRRNSTAA